MKNPTNLLNSHEQTVQEIAAVFSRAKKVLISTHERPDGDALGSSLALMHALQDAGKEVLVFLPDTAPDFFSYLPGLSTATTEKPDTTQYDAMILLDATQLYRTHLEAEALAHPQTVVIDHHVDNTKQAHINLVIPQAAATALILFELFQKLDLPITKDMATCLLTGIFTDTGSFMHDSVTPEVLEVSSYLMNKGARLSHIAHETYQKKDLSGLKIWGRALSRISTDPITGASVSIIVQKDLEECGATVDDLDGVVSMMNTLPQSKFAMLLIQIKPGKIKGSLRSEPHKHINVSRIARRLGGGGHTLASGFEIEGNLVLNDGTWRVEPAAA